MLTERQQHCLKGIGIQSWAERTATLDDRSAIGPVVESFSEALQAVDNAIDRSAQEVPSVDNAVDRSAQEVPAVDNAVDRSAQKVPAENPAIKTSAPSSFDSWDSLIDAIHGCNACELAHHCTQKVPGVGDRQADLLIIGEGPGHDEDIRGEPFVGRSGQLLDRMLAAIGIAREQVYITNIVKCRPPNNRDPKQNEAQQCRAFLEAQIEQIAPKVILSVGRVSAHNLLGSNQPVGKLIQQMHKLPGTEIPLKVTYHPAYLLRNPSAKAIAWQDLKLLHQMLR